MVTPTVRHLEFSRADNNSLSFIPGQFITFHFLIDGSQHQRSYSIASIPGQTNTIEIAVSPFVGGPGTQLLFNIQPGEQIETSGPFGRLTLRDEKPVRYVLVATGTGITPYRAMLPELLNRIQERNVTAIIYLGVQTPEDLLYGEDFLNFSHEHPNLEFHAFYSRKMPDKPQSFEHQGYVQNGFDQLNLNPKNDIIYLCGNPHMIDQAFIILREKGFETSQVRREKYISPKQ
jgi:ferredoxin-NADP reductase